MLHYAATFSFVAASTATIYGSENVPVGVASSGLHRIESTKGLSEEPYSGANPNRARGLAYNWATNTMYTLGIYSASLSTLDLSSPDAETTLICSGDVYLSGLTFSSDYSTLYSIQQFSKRPYSIDPTTGSSSAIGTRLGASISVLDLSTDSSGMVYGAGLVDGIYRVDTSTGIALYLN